jgi:predicted dehydrogenase
MGAEKRVRVGIVGAGGIVRGRHLPNLKQVAGVELACVCNRSRESGERVAKEFGIGRVEREWRAVVEAEDVDAVLVGTWPYMHCPVSVAALEAGKHVFCQARMAMNTREAREMAAKARETGLVAGLCYPPIGLKGDYVVRELLTSGFLGQVREVRVVDTSDAYVDASKPLHWRQNLKYSGVNTLTVGMYGEVLNRWIGPARRVAAQSATFVKERIDPETAKRALVEIPDAVYAAAELECGALGSYVFSGAVPAGQEASITLIGTKGSLFYHVGTDTITVIEAGEREWRAMPIPEGKERKWRVEADFVRAIREGTPVSPDFEEGVGYMAFTEAVVVSARTWKAVEPASLGL